MKCQSSDVSRDSTVASNVSNVSLVTFDFWRNILILLCPKLSWETLLYVLITPHTIYKSIKKEERWHPGWILCKFLWCEEVMLTFLGANLGNSGTSFIVVSLRQDHALSSEAPWEVEGFLYFYSSS